MQEKLVYINTRTWDYDDISYQKSKDGSTNAIIEFKGKKARLRAGMLVIKDNKILLSKTKDGYDIPGGGLNEYETPLQAGIRELQEEVYINVKNAQDTQLDYCLCCDEIEDWVEDNIPKKDQWYNYYTCLIIGEYDNKYEGKVAVKDKDNQMKNSCKWYKIKDIINEPEFNKQWKKALIKFGYYNDNLKEDFVEMSNKYDNNRHQLNNDESLNENLLLEVKRTKFINDSKNASGYKNTKFGKNRFERKKYSKIAGQKNTYNNLDINKFFKQDLLDVNIPVIGETDSYIVTIQLTGILNILRGLLKLNKYKFEYKLLLQAITKAFNTNDIKVNCTCDDFKYNFEHNLILSGGSTSDTSKDPGPGKGIKNPEDNKGKGCKHTLLCLDNKVWVMDIASVLFNYIKTIQIKQPKLFQDIIFPRLYGINFDSIKDEHLVPEDANLDKDNNIIELINQNK